MKFPWIINSNVQLTKPASKGEKKEKKKPFFPRFDSFVVFFLFAVFANIVYPNNLKQQDLDCVRT